jgi:hypothetical protein
MPLTKEQRAAYGPGWPAISRQVREEAGQRCERCAAPNGELIARGAGDRAGTYMVETGEVRDDTTGAVLGVARGSEYDVARMVKVVLTVAHLDGTLDHRRDNLAALCQQCHLRLDAPQHARNAAATRRARLAAGDLFASEGGG